MKNIIANAFKNANKENRPALISYTVCGDNNKKISLDMTLTSPHCPVAESLPMEVRRSVEEIPEVEEVEVKIVWDPPWDKTKMSESAKLELNL